MDSVTSLALLVVLVGVFLYVLYLVIRAAVREGVQQALDGRGLTTDEPEDAER